MKIAAIISFAKAAWPFVTHLLRIPWRHLCILYFPKHKTFRIGFVPRLYQQIAEISLSFPHGQRRTKKQNQLWRDKIVEATKTTIGAELDYEDCVDLESKVFGLWERHEQEAYEHSVVSEFYKLNSFKLSTTQRLILYNMTSKIKALRTLEGGIDSDNAEKYDRSMRAVLGEEEAMNQWENNSSLLDFRFKHGTPSWYQNDSIEENEDKK